MAKQIKRYASNGGISLPLPVASGATKDSVITLGTAGLFGYVLTDRATTATIQAGTAAQGLANGEASVFLPGIILETEQTVGANVTQFDAAYVTSGGVYTNVSTGNTKIGYFLTTAANAAKARIGLLSN